ncbi:MAG TPA: NAD-dependent epimerase/dehydratase family protein [Chthoniobacterales bacterium]|nr:NAD-dependent epimerase/dehydratase family protein [Chthoniobacterales bacterium]
MSAFPESILITGGAGFIGSTLALFIKARHPSARIACMDNLYRRGSELNLPRLHDAGIEFLQGDIRSPEQFPNEPFELILECSAEPSVLAGQDGSPDYVFQTNLVGTYNCLERARVWKSKFLFLSTSRVYPITILEAHPWVEDATRFRWKEEGSPGISAAGVTENVSMNGARSLYGFTKFASEMLIEEYRAAFGLRAVIDRCGVIAGPWQMGKVDQGFLALWVFNHLFEQPLRYIGYGGTGKQVRDVLHVGDLAELIEEQIISFDEWEGWIGNVSGGMNNSVSLCELTETCAKLTGVTLPIHQEPENRPNDVRIYIGDSSRLFARTDWRPKKSVGETAAEILEWAEQCRATLQPLFGPAK